MTFDIFQPDTTPSRPKRGVYERTAPMSETFTAGEEVTLTRTGERVRIAFGPFQSVSGGNGRYLVEFLAGDAAGHHGTVADVALERGPKFTTGDAVLVGALETPATVAAGPFKSHSDVTPFYVVEYESGSHQTRQEPYLKKDAASNTFHVGDVTYDLAATYNDNDGDGWTFTGMRGSDGTPLMDSPEAGSGYRNYSLTLVLSSFGPLRKRT